MNTVQKSVLIWYSPQEMFDLVTSVQQYPQFLPWCDHTRVLEQDDSGMLAEVGIALSGIRHSFVTRNLHEPAPAVTLHGYTAPAFHLTPATVHMRSGATTHGIASISCDATKPSLRGSLNG